MVLGLKSYQHQEMLLRLGRSLVAGAELGFGLSDPSRSTATWLSLVLRELTLLVCPIGGNLP